MHHMARWISFYQLPIMPRMILHLGSITDMCRLHPMQFEDIRHMSVIPSLYKIARGAAASCGGRLTQRIHI